ncbi:AAA family ATPase [Actinoplanes subglobosus]|uniref:AAA family ATPase n=1 Tax=Actinoplanes subglobosus TaxID=1547892 RepID=A0ABV8J6H0_9ACTN
MYLKTIRLNNVRGFHSARNVALDLTRPDGSFAGWTVLAGRNGSGKTSLLRAVALALGGPKVATYLVADFSRWLAAGQQSAMWQVRVIRDVRRDRFRGGEPWEGHPLSFGLSLDLPPESWRERSDVEPLLGLLDDPTEPGSATSGPWDANASGWFCAAYGPFRRLADVSGSAHRPLPKNGPAARIAGLFDDNIPLAEGVSWLIEQHLRALEARPGAESLKSAALAVLGDGLLPDGFQVRDVDSEGLWVERGGHRFPLREMSDGFRAVAALVVDLLKQLHDCYGGLDVEYADGSPTVTAPGVVLIDEVDAHLHVSWQKRIGNWLKTHFPRIQFIVTTHSPYICQAADENGLIRLPGPDEDEPPRIVEQDLYERIVYGSGDDAVMSELFGLDTPYSEEAVRLRRELVALETDVLLGSADEAAVRRYEDLRDRLSSSPAARADELAARIVSDAEQRPR